MSQYGAPPPPPQQPYPSAGPPPQNNLVWAILSTLLCCLPLGVASIVFATQVNTKWAMGDVAGAHQSAEKAKKFAMWSAIVAVICWVIYILFWVFVIGASSTMD
ncbi:MAG: CD225/dispanin family protein [Actinomycetales bacterium]|nr:CD225/dispanin family protein [Actinomycetales bacterium]